MPVVLLIGAAAAVGIYLGGRAEDPPKAAATSPQRQPSPTAKDTTAIAEGLASGDPSRLAEVVALPADQPLDPAAVESLAALDVQIDPATFSPITEDGRTGTADARVTGPDGTVSSWTVTLLRTGSTWQLVVSEPVS